MFSAPKFKAQKFHDWLMSTVNLELKANAFAIEIISYLAYETVAQVVVYAPILWWSLCNKYCHSNNVTYRT